MFSFECVRLFGFFLIDLLSDLLTHGHTLKVLDAAYGFVAIISGIKVVMSGCLIFSSFCCILLGQGNLPNAYAALQCFV